MAQGGSGLAAHPVGHLLVVGQGQQDVSPFLGAAQLAQGGSGLAAHPGVHLLLIAGQGQQAVQHFLLGVPQLAQGRSGGEAHPGVHLLVAG